MLTFVCMNIGFIKLLYFQSSFLNYGEICVRIKELMEEFQKKSQSTTKVETIADMKVGDLKNSKLTFGFYGFNFSSWKINLTRRLSRTIHNSRKCQAQCPNTWRSWANCRVLLQLTISWRYRKPSNRSPVKRATQKWSKWESKLTLHARWRNVWNEE